MSVSVKDINEAIAANFPGLLSVDARVVDRDLMFIDLEAAPHADETLAEVRAWAMLYVVPVSYAVVVQWRAF